MDRAVLSHDGPWTEEAYLALSHDGRAEVVDGTLLVGPAAGKERLQVIERVREAVAAALPGGLRVIGPVPLRLGPDCVLMPDLVVTSEQTAARAEPGAEDPDAASDAAPEDAAPEDTAPEGAVPDTAGSVPASAGTAATADAAGDAGADEPGSAGPDATPDTATDTAPDTAAASGEAAADEPGPDGTAAIERGAVLDADDALMVVEVIGRVHGAADRAFKPQLYARSGIPYSVLIDHEAPFAVAEMIIGGRYHEYAFAGEGTALRIEEPFPLELDLTGITAPDASADPATDPAAAG